MHVVGDLVALVDRGRDVALVLEACLERLEVVLEGLIGLGDGCHLDLVVVVQKVTAENLGVRDLLLYLDHVPVSEALEAALLVVVCKREIEIGGVELLVDLRVKGVADLLVECHGKPFLPARWACKHLCQR